MESSPKDQQGAAGGSCRSAPGQVVHLLLGPQADDFAGVELAEALLEAIIVLDVAVAVLELVERRLEDLEHHLIWDHNLRLLLQPVHTDTHTETHKHDNDMNLHH